MAVSWNPSLLNQYLAPGIAEFTDAKIPDVKAESDQVEHWMANHFLNNVFRVRYTGKYRQLIFNVIYRAQACFEHYEHAREMTLQYVAAATPHNPKLRIYYGGLRSWEACFLNLQMFVDLLKRIGGTAIFHSGDGSPEERSYQIANSIKHWGGVIDRDEHDEGDTVPMWLTNTGFQTRTHHLAYEELAELLREQAKVVTSLQDPLAYAAETAPT